MTVRATRIAAITASEPVLQKATRSIPVNSRQQRGHLARERRLRADLEALLQLRVDRFDARSWRRWPKRIMPKPLSEIDVLVAVDVPELRSGRAYGHDRIHDLLPQQPESGDGPGIREEWPALGGQPFRAGGATGIALDELLQTLFLARRQSPGGPLGRWPIRAECDLGLLNRCFGSWPRRLDDGWSGRWGRFQWCVVPGLGLAGH